MTTRVNVVPLASALRDEKAIQERLSHYLGELRAVKGFEFSVTALESQGPETAADVMLILALSGGIERQALEFLASSDWPALILAHPADNALAAAIEILAQLNLMGRRGRIVQAVAGWQGELQELLAVFASRARIARARLGVIGTRAVEVLEPWRLTERVRSVWGPLLVRRELSELVEAVQAVSPEEATGAAQEFGSGARRVVEADSATLIGAARIYVGLKTLVEKYQLNAVTVKCFDLLPVLRNTGCYALARLNEEGIPAACEADVLSALGMLFLWELTGQPSFMANPSVIESTRGRVTLAHCTIARTMTQGYVIRSHFESGMGVAIQGDVPPGPVTVVRLGGRRLDGVFAARGNLLQCGTKEDMCRTQLTIEFADPEDAETMLSSPLGNHHLVVAGDWEKRIDKFTSLFIRTGA